MEMIILLILMFAIAAVIVAFAITAFFAWKHTRGRSYAIQEKDVIDKEDISLDDAVKFLKLTNIDIKKD